MKYLFYSSQQQRPSQHDPIIKAKTDKVNRVNRVKGGPNRDLETLMELQMNKVRIINDKYFHFLIFIFYICLEYITLLLDVFYKS